MTNIFLFVPKAQLSSRQHLDEFILMCRDRLTVFGADLDWYSNAWPTRTVSTVQIAGVSIRSKPSNELIN